MKKVTLETIRTALLDAGYESTDPVMVEIDTELNKGAARKEATANAYEAAKDVILNALGDAPATCSEIYEAIKGELPEGFGRGKVQYALTNLWQDAIVKVDGSPKSYRRNWDK